MNFRHLIPLVAEDLTNWTEKKNSTWLNLGRRRNRKGDLSRVTVTLHEQTIQMGFLVSDIKQSNAMKL